MYTWHSSCYQKPYFKNFTLDTCDPFCENLPKRAKTTIEIWLKVGNNLIFSNCLKTYFLNPYHSFNLVRSFEVFSSPYASGELLLLLTTPFSHQNGNFTTSVASLSLEVSRLTYRRFCCWTLPIHIIYSITKVCSRSLCIRK